MTTPHTAARTQLHAFRQRTGAERPTSPGRDYGVPAAGGELMTWEYVAERLRDARSYWVATVDPAARPGVMPIWGVFVDDDLFVETGPTTRKARNLARNPAVAVHLDDGDHLVALEGRAEPWQPDAELGPRLAAAYAAKYPGYTPGPRDWDGGGLYLIVPRVLFAWRDMPTATRWRFTTAR